MKKSFLIIFSVLILTALVSTEYQEQEKYLLLNPYIKIPKQIQNDYWIKAYVGGKSGIAYSIKQTDDGGYIVAGTMGVVASGNSDIWLMKLSATGRIEWQSSYGGPDSEESFWIDQTSDGGYIVAGYSISFSSGSKDVLILKLTQNGAIEWQRTYGGADSEEALSIEQTNDGGYIVTGYIDSVTDVLKEMLLMKLDANGNINWQRAYSNGDSAIASSVQQTNDGGYIVAGETNLVSHGDIWVLKLFSNGTIEWQRSYGGASKESFYISNIQQTNDGGYILAGSTYSFSGTGDSIWWIVKLSSFGDIEWQKICTGGPAENARSVQQAGDGGYIVSGNIYSEVNKSSDFGIVKFSSVGQLEWHKVYGGNNFDTAYCIQNTQDGGFVVVGYSGGYAPIGGDTGIVIFKLSNEGTVGPCEFNNNAKISTFDSKATPVITTTIPQNPNLIASNVNVSRQITSVSESLICWNLCQPPENITLANEVNRSLFRIETYLRLNWSPNPYNNQFTITEYRIYSEYAGNYELIGSVSGNTYEYRAGPFSGGEDMKYAITSVDSEGNESPKSQTVES